MKKDETSAPDPDISEEYDFSQGVRGKHHERYRRGTNVVLLDPDLRRDFPTSESVNEALRRYREMTRTRQAG